MSDGQGGTEVWEELWETVNQLKDTVDLSIQVFGSDGQDKAMSATTKKRLISKSIAQLKQGKDGVQVITEHLKVLQKVSQAWQRSMMYASKEHHELMEQLENTTKELHSANERLRVVEGQRSAASKDMESMRKQFVQMDSHSKTMQNMYNQRGEELETLQFNLHEAEANLSQMQSEMERLKREAAEAKDEATAATSSRADLRAEASKASASAGRHQEVVAKLTADNLMFLMQLKKVEADLAAADQERARLKLAAEKQRGPWFEQVRAGVEDRVRQAMTRAQDLEAELEAATRRHQEEEQALEAALAALRTERDGLLSQRAELEVRLEGAQESADRCRAAEEAARAAAAEAAAALEHVEAERRVLQENTRNMRQECTERWVNEQAALNQLKSVESRFAAMQDEIHARGNRIQEIQVDLQTQFMVNRQLMQKKEEVEWQLMAALAKVKTINELHFDKQQPGLPSQLPRVSMAPPSSVFPQYPHLHPNHMMPPPHHHLHSQHSPAAQPLPGAAPNGGGPRTEGDPRSFPPPPPPSGFYREPSDLGAWPPVEQDRPPAHASPYPARYHPSYPPAPAPMQAGPNVSYTSEPAATLSAPPPVQPHANSVNGSRGPSPPPPAHLLPASASWTSRTIDSNKPPPHSSAPLIHTPAPAAVYPPAAEQQQQWEVQIQGQVASSGLETPWVERHDSLEGAVSSPRSRHVPLGSWPESRPGSQDLSELDSVPRSTVPDAGSSQSRFSEARVPSPTASRSAEPCAPASPSSPPVSPTPDASADIGAARLAADLAALGIRRESPASGPSSSRGEGNYHSGSVERITTESDSTSASSVESVSRRTISAPNQDSAKDYRRHMTSRVTSGSSLAACSGLDRVGFDDEEGRGYPDSPGNPESLPHRESLDSESGNLSIITNTPASPGRPPPSQPGARSLETVSSSSTTQSPRPTSDKGVRLAAAQQSSSLTESPSCSLYLSVDSRERDVEGSEARAFTPPVATSYRATPCHPLLASILAGRPSQLPVTGRDSEDDAREGVARKRSSFGAIASQGDTFLAAGLLVGSPSLTTYNTFSVGSLAPPQRSDQRSSSSSSFVQVSCAIQPHVSTSRSPPELGSSVGKGRGGHGALSVRVGQPALSFAPSLFVGGLGSLSRSRGPSDVGSTSASDNDERDAPCGHEENQKLVDEMLSFRVPSHSLRSNYNSTSYTAASSQNRNGSDSDAAKGASLSAVRLCHPLLVSLQHYRSVAATAERDGVSSIVDDGEGRAGGHRSPPLENYALRTASAPAPASVQDKNRNRPCIVPMMHSDDVVRGDKALLGWSPDLDAGADAAKTKQGRSQSENAGSSLIPEELTRSSSSSSSSSASSSDSSENSMMPSWAFSLKPSRGQQDSGSGALPPPPPGGITIPGHDPRSRRNSLEAAEKLGERTFHALVVSRMTSFDSGSSLGSVDRVLLQNRECHVLKEACQTECSDSSAAAEELRYPDVGRTVCDATTEEVGSPSRKSFGAPVSICGASSAQGSAQPWALGLASALFLSDDDAYTFSRPAPRAPPASTPAINARLSPLSPSSAAEGGDDGEVPKSPEDRECVAEGERERTERSLTGGAERELLHSKSTSHEGGRSLVVVCKVEGVPQDHHGCLVDSRLDGDALGSAAFQKPEHTNEEERRKSFTFQDHEGLASSACNSRKVKMNPGDVLNERECHNVGGFSRCGETGTSGWVDVGTVARSSAGSECSGKDAGEAGRRERPDREIRGGNTEAQETADVSDAVVVAVADVENISSASCLAETFLGSRSPPLPGAFEHLFLQVVDQVRDAGTNNITLAVTPDTGSVESSKSASNEVHHGPGGSPEGLQATPLILSPRRLSSGAPPKRSPEHPVFAAAAPTAGEWAPKALALSGALPLAVSETLRPSVERDGENGLDDKNRREMSDNTRSASRKSHQHFPPVHLGASRLAHAHLDQQRVDTSPSASSPLFSPCLLASRSGSQSPALVPFSLHPCLSPGPTGAPPSLTFALEGSSSHAAAACGTTDPGILPAAAGGSLTRPTLPTKALLDALFLDHHLRDAIFPSSADTSSFSSTHNSCSPIPCTDMTLRSSNSVARFAELLLTVARQSVISQPRPAGPRTLSYLGDETPSLNTTCSSRGIVSSNGLKDNSITYIFASRPRLGGVASAQSGSALPWPSAATASAQQLAYESLAERTDSRPVPPAAEVSSGQPYIANGEPVPDAEVEESVQKFSVSVNTLLRQQLSLSVDGASEWAGVPQRDAAPFGNAGTGRRTLEWVLTGQGCSEFKAVERSVIEKHDDEILADESSSHGCESFEGEDKAIADCASAAFGACHPPGGSGIDPPGQPEPELYKPSGVLIHPAACIFPFPAPGHCSEATEGSQTSGGDG